MALAPAPISRTWTGMPRTSTWNQITPDIGAHQLLVFGLRDQHGVGLVAAQMRHQRAVAGGFLLDHRLHVDGRGRLQADAAQRVEGEQVGGVAGLHVARRRGRSSQSPSIDRLEGRMRPHVGAGRSARRRHAPAGSASGRSRSRGRWMPTTIGACECSARERRAAGMALDRGRGPWRSGPWRSRDRASARNTKSWIACSAPRSEAEADQLLREGDLLVEAGLDGGEDVVAKGGIEGTLA